MSYHQKNIIEETSLLKESQQCGFNSHLNLTPDINQFINQFEQYVFAFDDVRHHTLAQHDYLADVLDNIDDFYLLKDLPKLHQKLNNLMGKPLLLSHLMESKAKPTSSYQGLLDNSTLTKLQKFYADDLMLLSNSNNLS